MDEIAPRRSGGRAARQAARLASHAEHVPFLTRKLAPFEVLDEEGLSLIEHNADTILQEVGLEFRGDPGRAATAPRGRCVRRRGAGPVPARDVPLDRPGDRATPVHPVRAEPGTERRDRRDAHGLRPELRLAVRPRPGRRPPVRHDRGLPQPREARLRVAASPPLGRDGVRAGGRAGQQAPPRHGLFAHPLQRQAVHGLGDGAAARPRHRRARPDRVRGGLSRGPHGPAQPHQRELTARLGLGDARRGPRVRRGEPGDPADAVHPGRRDGPGHRGRCLRPDPGRGPRRHDVRPARPAGRAGRPRVVRELDVHAVGRADLRDAGAGTRAVRDGRAGAPARRPVPVRRLAVRLEGRRCAGRLRVRRHAPADRPGRRQLRPPCRGLARGRADRGLREIHHGRGPVRDDGRLHGRAWTSPTTARPSTRS